VLGHVAGVQLAHDGVTASALARIDPPPLARNDPARARRRKPDRVA
jgi:hypothetical protein